MDINAVKLKRLVAFLRDDGDPTPEQVAKYISAKAENHVFLREYVVAAAEELKQPDIVDTFDGHVKTATGAAEEPKGKEAPENEIQSEPEAPAPKTPVKLPEQTAPKSPFADEPVKPAPANFSAGVSPEAQKATNAALGIKQTLGSTGGLRFRYRDVNGFTTDLVVVHEREGIVLLEKKPEEEIVQVTLKGSNIELNLTKLRGRPAGDTAETAVGPFTVATLLVIAEAAKA